MKKKIVILGYGKISRKHIDALKNNKKNLRLWEFATPIKLN